MRSTATATATATAAVSSANSAPEFGPLQTTTQVSVFSYPNLNGPDANPGTGNENANLASIVQSVINQGGDYRLDTTIQSFADSGFSAKLNASGFFFMTDMESGNPADPAFLPDDAKATIRDWVSNGGVIMMTGTYGSNDTKFLNTIFGWDLTTQTGSGWSLNEANAAGTPFAGGPANLSSEDATDSIGKGSVADFKAIYGSDENATVAVIPYGAGTVIFLGFDYYSAGIAGTGFQASAPQYLEDVTNGSSRLNAWVTEMIPRAMQYSADLSSGSILSEGDSGLETSGTLAISDADGDTVTVTATAIEVVQQDSSGAVIASSGQLPDNSALLAMVAISPEPVLDGTQTEGRLSWTFDSGDEAFNYLRAGEKLVLTYTLTADDGNGGTDHSTIELVINGTNDLPTIEGMPVQPQAVTAGKSASLANFTVQDPDATELTVTLTALNGEIGGLKGWTQSENVWSKTATAAELNTALASATFKAASAGDASIKVSVSDESEIVTTAVYDLTAGKAPKPSPVKIVDGVDVSTTATELPDGTVGQAVFIPVVAGGRTEQSGAPDVADIPLASSASGTTLLAQLPTGFGLTAKGGASSTAGSSLVTLIEAIKAASSSHDMGDQAHLTGNGSAFLAGLASGRPLLVQTITPFTDGGNPPSAPLVITGASASSQHTALVIDASSLPAGSAIHLNNVEFASVIGSVSVTGSQPGQMLSGDAASQTFVLSGGASSQVYSGGGDDIIEMRSPDATHLASSSSLLHGGTASDTVIFSGAQADYMIEQKDGFVLVTSVADPSQQEKLINIETLRFSDGDTAIESRSELSLLAGLYQNILGRQADVGGFDYWGNQQGTGAMSMGQIALSMVASAESAADGQLFKGDAETDVELLYQTLFNRASDAAGKAYWVEQMNDAALTLQDVANAFVASVEMSGYAQTATEWDFFV